jgi:hypothetical protein
LINNANAYLSIINSNIIGGNSISPVHSISTGSNNVLISGNILNAPNGTQAIYAPIYRIDPVPTNGYIRYARNGTGVGSDAYTTLYTADTFSSFSAPPVSAVRVGISYANGLLTGTSQIPPTSAVAFGTVYDSSGSRTGLAYNSANVIFNTPISAINIPNSIGDRLKKSATVESTGHLVASFSN